MQNLLKQAQKMQKELAKMEDSLKEETYESTMGGGVVKVTVTGNMEVTDITLADDVIDVETKEDLQEMIKAAVNDALSKASTDKEKKMNALTGGIKMPGGF